MESVLISIQPKWCELIASGKKTIELRKTRPKINTPFKCYIYCTNTKPYLVWGDVFRGNWETEFTHLSGYNRKDAEKIWEVFNGKVIGEFVCDSIKTYPADDFVGAEDLDGTIITEPKEGEFAYWILEEAETCLSYKEILEYGNAKTLYGWHISDLVIYDEPKELSKFYITDKKAVRQCSNRRQAYYSFTDTGYIKNGFYCEEKDDFCFDGCKRKVLTRPPQSWCYVEELR